MTRARRISLNLVGVLIALVLWELVGRAKGEALLAPPSLVAKEYLDLWSEEGWGERGTVIRSTCPVIVETIRNQYPELIPHLAPVATPIAAEARYLKALYGEDTPVVYAGVCLTEGGEDVDAAITLAEPSTIVLQQDLDGDGAIAGNGETVTWLLRGSVLRRNAG